MLCSLRPARKQPDTFVFRDPTPIPEYWSNLKSTPATILPSSNSTTRRVQSHGRRHRRQEITSSTSSQGLSHSALASGQLYNPYSFPNPHSPPFPFGVPVSRPFSRKWNTSQPEIMYLRGNDLQRRPCRSQRISLPPRGILVKSAGTQNANTRRTSRGRHIRFVSPRSSTQY
jgi:hypothetical protein